MSAAGTAVLRALELWLATSRTLRASWATIEAAAAQATQDAGEAAVLTGKVAQISRDIWALQAWTAEAWDRIEAALRIVSEQAPCEASLAAVRAFAALEGPRSQWAWRVSGDVRQEAAEVALEEAALRACRALADVDE